MKPRSTSSCAPTFMHTRSVMTWHTQCCARSCPTPLSSPMIICLLYQVLA
jgi:hypothetical protein